MQVQLTKLKLSSDLHVDLHVEYIRLMLQFDTFAACMFEKRKKF